ncbi:hypothetical protein F4824DRAFT_505150 [Ustulina deusta]|nr:hypothetical protein F4824DRAFT_505150 [Ustulina deusta]
MYRALGSEKLFITRKVFSISLLAFKGASLATGWASKAYSLPNSWTARLSAAVEMATILEAPSAAVASPRRPEALRTMGSREAGRGGSEEGSVLVVGDSGSGIIAILGGHRRRRRQGRRIPLDDLASSGPSSTVGKLIFYKANNSSII